MDERQLLYDALLFALEINAWDAADLGGFVDEAWTRARMMVEEQMRDAFRPLVDGQAASETDG